MKEVIISCKTLPHKERVKVLRNLKLPQLFKEEFNFFTRPGSKLDIDFLLSASRNTQNDYLAYLIEEPLVMTERLKNRLSSSKNIIAKLLQRKNLDTSECNYVAINSAGQLTFHPKPWLQTFDANGDFNKEGRQVISLAKLLRRLGLISKRSTKLLAPHIEQCTHSFVNEYELKETTFKIAYDYPVDGWQTTSCMRGKPVNHVYKSLGAIPMLLYQDGIVVGRFLKWELPGGTYFDRLYFKEEKNFNWLKQYCKDNKIGEWSKGVKQSMVVENALDFDEYIPYMDTWKYYSPDLKTFYTSKEAMGDACKALHYCLEDQNGNYATYNKGKRICAATGEVHDSSHLVRATSGKYAGRYIKKEYETES